LLNIFFPLGQTLNVAHD